VLNALSGLRFDLKASMYCAIASILIVFGLGAYDAYRGYFPFAGGAILETVIKAFLLGGTALVSGYIGHRSRRLIVQAVKEQEEKRFVKGIFGRHATEEVVEDALRRGLKLGGEERDVTILFCDIRNFTGLAEKLQPNEVVDLLNDYFAEMVGVISKNGGTLNKFIGDGILAIFGAPVSHSNDAERAVRTALEMMGKLEEFNRRQAEKGGVELRIGVGINTGRVVVGNVGSIERMEYTAIGDAVNLASRLDELNKELGTSVLISHDTYQQIKGIIHTRELQPVKVKGKEERVRVYEVIRDKTV
jgi:adenylate cyclase